ncbi:ATP-grasp domain-containing protein [bacterium]|nr:ATP-grasp domain-containing protein [bacterium]
MIILENPYVSQYLVETIKKNNFSVLDNEIARNFFKENEMVFGQKAIELAKKEGVYSNSENSIDWVFENLKNEEIASMIQISKDKYAFRKALKNIFPNYYFEKFNISELKNISIDKLKFPFVLKPCVGFLSFGVYPVKNAQDFNNVLSKLDLDIERLKNVFPISVVDCSEFIIEEMIDGDEYAIDAYFDKDGKATVLNIFAHPFYDENDVSDRIYYTSKEIMQKHLQDFEELLNKIGVACEYKNFPFHLELRVNSNNIIPIEINPMRFCGWCITDIAQNAWGINVYEYFINNKKPNWNEILKNSDNALYYFTIGDIPSEIDKDEIKEIDYDKYLKNISNPLEIRKIDYKTKPVFAIVFAKTNEAKEIKNILKLGMADFIIRK